jgi:NAD(P)-dependent dehydrogenase (short-subunit alcohol dehydrogenase family)
MHEPEAAQRQANGQAGAPGELAGQTAVVTGASGGIGRAIAEELARRGASLCVLGRRLETLRVVPPRPDGGARRLAYRVDLTVQTELERLIDELRRDLPAVDILVHSAGDIALGTVEQGAVEDFDRQIQINLRAPYRLTQALLPQLKARRGQIVFINSSAGTRAVPGSGAYSASKHGLKGLADSLRAEVSGQVRVTSVFTGTTATPMQASLHAAKGRPYAPEKLIQPADVAAVVGHVLALPRTVELTDIHMRPALPPD